LNLIRKGFSVAKLERLDDIFVEPFSDWLYMSSISLSYMKKRNIKSELKFNTQENIYFHLQEPEKLLDDSLVIESSIEDMQRGYKTQK
jgi:hypothetical protein